MALNVSIDLVEWQFKEGGSWCSFPKDVNRSIEDAYRAQKKSLTINNGWNKRYVVDFSRWEVASHSSYGRRSEIQRIVNLTPEQRKEKENAKIRDAFLTKMRSKVQKIFKKYAALSSSTEEIDIDGVSTLIDDIGLDPMDVDVLVFCWLCDAKKQATFRFEEFALGLAKLKCAKLSELKASLQKYSSIVLSNPALFEDLYSFTFSYIKEGSSVRIESASAYWSLLLSTQKFCLVDEFVEFLDDDHSSGEKRTIPDAVSRDGWQQMLRFFRDLKEDLTGYDEACSPSLADTFVAFMKKQRTKTSSAPSSTNKDEEDDMDW